MRRWLIAISILSVGCTQASPPAVFGVPEWRTANGHVLTTAEVQALQQSCTPGLIAVPIDRDRPWHSAERFSPAYRPGGEGLVNALPNGIASADNPIVPTALIGRRAALPMEQCLLEKGVMRSY